MLELARPKKMARQSLARAVQSAWSRRRADSGSGANSALVAAIEKYEKEVSSKGGNVPETLDGIVAASHSLKDAVKGTRDLVVLTKKVALGVRVSALPLMGSKVFQEKHKHFFTALDNLEVQCRNSPDMVPSAYRV